MTRVLIVAEHDGRTLNESTARCVRCASSLSEAQLSIVVFAADAAIAQQAAQLQGVSEVLALTDAAYAHPLAALLAPQIAHIAEPFALLLGPATTFGKDLMPRVAALIDAPQISEIMAIESPRRFRRPIYAGNAVAVVEAGDEPHLVGTVRTASFAAAASGAAATLRTLVPSSAPAPTHTRFISVSTPDAQRPDLQSATRVVSGGRGVGSAENFKLIYALADRLHAAVGASRAAVDAGYVPNDLQVGQTGKIIAPQLYLAIGISGAIQHLTGIKDARTIVAINKDADAPIFEIADLGLVGDLFQILPELQRLLASAN